MGCRNRGLLQEEMSHQSHLRYLQLMLARRWEIERNIVEQAWVLTYITPSGASLWSVMLNYQLRFLFSDQRFVPAFCQSSKPFLKYQTEYVLLVQVLFAQVTSILGQRSLSIWLWLFAHEFPHRYVLTRGGSTSGNSISGAISYSFYKDTLVSQRFQHNSPPNTSPAPESALQCHIGYQRAQPIPFSYNETPVLEPTTELGGGNFRWSRFFWEDSKWLMQQYLCFLLTIDK